MDLFELERKHRVLKELDFSLGSATPIALQWTDCFIVLFYNSGVQEDRLALDVFVAAARKASVAIFGIVDLAYETRVADAFAETSQNANNPLHDFALKQTPGVLVYRDRFPQAFYNGNFSVSELIDFTFSFACAAEFHERKQLTGPLKVTSFTKETNEYVRLEKL